MKIAISPDENPGDPGSIAADGTTERSVNLKVCAALQIALQRSGVNAWFDPSITFTERVAQANDSSADVLVACAHNESTAGKSGTEFVFCPGGTTFGRQSQAAAAVMAELAQLPGWPARIGDAIENVYECCNFERDTVYIEYLFMSPDDEHLWRQLAYPTMVAEATARALARTYGFTYQPPADPASQPPPPTSLPGPNEWRPTATTRSEHWWGPYVEGATQVVELPMLCHGAVYLPGQGHWFRDQTVIGTPVTGEFAEWSLSNLVGGNWYDMDESGGPQGQGANGRLAVDQSFWIDDRVIDTTGCGGVTPPDVAKVRGGKWWWITG